MVFIAVWPSSRLIQFSHTFLSPCNIRRPPHHVCLCRLIPPVFSLFACPSDRADLHLALSPPGTDRATEQERPEGGQDKTLACAMRSLCGESTVPICPAEATEGGRRTEDGGRSRNGTLGAHFGGLQQGWGTESTFFGCWCDGGCVADRSPEGASGAELFVWCRRRQTRAG